jgi:hypothetical protein
MTTYLVFNTKLASTKAQQVVADNMGFYGGSTTDWAIPQQMKNKKWAFVKPENTYMDGVLNYSEIDDPIFPVNPDVI